jgi:hypothetical protein
VLGIDNVIFISILAGKLPVELQAKARRLGLSLALDHAGAPAVEHYLAHEPDQNALHAPADQPRSCRGAI